MLAEKTAVAEKIAENNKEKEACSIELEKVKNLKVELEERISELKDQLKFAQERLKKFESYLDKNSAYMYNIQNMMKYRV